MNGHERASRILLALFTLWALAMVARWLSHDLSRFTGISSCFLRRRPGAPPLRGDLPLPGLSIMTSSALGAQRDGAGQHGAAGDSQLARPSGSGRPLVVTYHPSAAIRFGPNGAPLAALRDDLATVAHLMLGFS